MIKKTFSLIIYPYKTQADDSHPKKSIITDLKPFLVTRKTVHWH